MGLAQDDEPTLPPEASVSETEPEDANTPAGQEVEINEDNYRQFMELKDARQRRGVLPEEAFKPKSGLQKLDKLPEDSQKHLRNQLREIIVQGDQWQPGDEAESYPYVPSQAARTNQPLQKQEAEAWGELVDSYHKREAQIYENSTRSQAAMASEDSSGGGENTGNGSPGDGTGQPGAGEPGNQQSRTEPGSTAGSYSPGGSNDPSANSTAGVSQNAMQFLNQIRNEGANSSEGSSGSPASNNAQGDRQTQGGPENSSNQNKTVDISPPNPSAEKNAESTAGSSQNAMEFLQESGNQQGTKAEGSADDSANSSGQGTDQGQAEGLADQQSDDEQEAAVSTLPPSTTENAPDEPSTTGASQNALEYLTGEDTQRSTGQTMPTDPIERGDTLTIEDLMNAQGVGGPSPDLPPEKITNDQQDPDGNTPDKDGGG